MVCNALFFFENLCGFENSFSLLGKQNSVRNSCWNAIIEKIFSSYPPLGNLQVMTKTSIFLQKAKISLPLIWTKILKTSPRIPSLLRCYFQRVALWIFHRMTSSWTVYSQSHPQLEKHRDAADTSVFFFLAFLYYSSICCNWWDFGGMSSVYIEIGGIHPTPCRPKPLPTTPHNSDVMIKLLSQKEEVWSESLCPFKKVKVL